MEVKRGYKQTAVGVIPEDWDVRHLGEIASVAAGGTPSRAIARYWNGGIPWITTSEVDFHTINHAEQFITKEGLSNSAAKLLPPGTVLMALYGQGKTRGKVAVLGIEAATNQACAAISLGRGVSSSFVLHFLGSQYEAIRNLSNTGNQENLNSSLVRSILLLLPAKAEQEAIVQALSDADALIESLEQLLAKKRQIKQGTMQELLTGKKRLPGFSEQWNTTPLGNASNLLKGSGLSIAKLSASGNRPCILYGELFTTYNRVITRAVSRTDSDEGLLSMSGDVLMPGSTTTTGIDLATASALLVDNVALGGDINVIRQKSADYDSSFLANYLTHTMRNAVAKAAQGTTIHHLYGRDLRRMCLRLPSLPEQVAIAAILSDMDAGIAALEGRLAKTRELKQGMMQELLTGKIRLV